MEDQKGLMAYYRKGERAVLVLANLKAQSQAVSVELPFRLLLNNMETCQMENDLILLKPWQGIVVETENAFS